MKKFRHEKPDRLSDLTDDLISRILCFLPTKDAAQTSSLSRRWEHLFINLPKIHVQENYAAKHPEMVRFVNRWLSTPPLTEFLLRIRSLPEPPAVVVSWITRLLSNNVKILDITHNRPSRTLIRLFLPTELFHSRSLEVMKIRGRSFIAKVPESSCCPNLKVLHLNCLDIRNDSGYDLKFGVQNFPLLEDLSLSNGNHEFGPFSVSKDEGKSNITISSTTLKRVAVNYQEEMLTSILIDAPNLEHMMLQAGVREDTNVNVRKCEALESAYIQQFVPDNLFLQLMSSISGVRRLHLSWGSETFSDIPYFPNLVHLELTNTQGDTAWHFLGRAPNLEHFVYNRGKLEHNWPSSENVPICFSQSLRHIILRSLCWEEEMSSDEEILKEEPAEEAFEDGFQREIVAAMNQLQNIERLLPEFDKTDEGYEEEEEELAKEESDDEEEMSDAKIDVATYFLQHGAVLERVIVEHSQPMTAQFRLSTMNRLQNSERLSQKCEVVLRRMKKVKLSERYF